MKIALAQMAPKLARASDNLARHLDLVARARRHGAGLVVFPELSLTGYLLQDLVPSVAEPWPAGGMLRRLAAASRRAAIVAGFVERAPGSMLYNAAGLFHAGRARHVHRKVYLPTYGMFDEGRYFAPGERFATYRAPWGRTGVLICEDFWHLSSSWLLALSGMDLLLVVSASPVKGIGSSRKLHSAAIWKELAVVVARHLACWVVCVNRAGYEDGWTFQGGSFVCSPSGEVTAEAKLLEEDLVVTEVDSMETRKARLNVPLLRDEKHDLVRRELERILAARGEPEPARRTASRSGK